MHPCAVTSTHYYKTDDGILPIKLVANDGASANGKADLAERLLSAMSGLAGARPPG